MKTLFDWFAGLVFAAQPPVYYYVDVPYRNLDDLKRVVEAGFDVGGVNFERGTASLVVAESELERVRSYNVLSKRRMLAPDSAFKSPDEIEKFLRDTESNYPYITRMEKIGKSGEGRDIYAMLVTSTFVADPKPAVVFEAMHHAREVMTPEVALDIIDYLTKNYATDAKVRKWVNSYNIWVVPMINPDGNNKVWTGSSMWRKNTRGGYGVDINRNYPYAWNTCQGSSGSTGSDTYRGPSAGSEPETNVVMDLIKRVRPKFDISYHSYSEIVIYPYGCDPEKVPSPDADIYLKTGKELAKRLVRDSGSGNYRPGTSYELLYNVDGGSIDWMYSYDKVMAFVIEVNSDSQGFQPSYAQWRDSTVQRQRPGWQYILDQLAEPGIKR